MRRRGELSRSLARSHRDRQPGTTRGCGQRRQNRMGRVATRSDAESVERRRDGTRASELRPGASLAVYSAVAPRGRRSASCAGSTSARLRDQAEMPVLERTRRYAVARPRRRPESRRRVSCARVPIRASSSETKGADTEGVALASAITGRAGNRSRIAPCATKTSGNRPLGGVDGMRLTAS